MTTPQEFAQLHRLAPAQALAHLQQRGRITPTYGWQDLWQDEHSRQFTISRLTRADLLQAIRDKITASVQGDLSRTDFIRDTKAMLQQAGWWGKVEVTEPTTGEIHRTTFNPARLNLIFDVNTRQAHAAGQWEGHQRSKATHPYLRYITKRDERVRELHRQWDNLTLPIDDAFWKTHYPPNGWRCRCRVVAVSQRDYDRGTTPNGEPMVKTAPDLVWKQWENRRSGQIETIPTGIDPGFGHNPGLSRANAQQTLIRDKLLTIDAPTGAALWPTLPPTIATEQQRNWQSMAQRLASTRQASGEALLTHVIDTSTLQALQQHGIQPSSAAILMRDTELLHALRDTKVTRGAHLTEDFWAQLPRQLAQATPYLDTADQALLYAVPLPDGKVGKIVIRLNYTDKARLGRQRQRVTANFIQTGGVVVDKNLSTGVQYIRLDKE